MQFQGSAIHITIDRGRASVRRRADPVIVIGGIVPAVLIGDDFAMLNGLTGIGPGDSTQR